jgi:ABC-type xylose transport system permease subunit
MRLFFNNSSGNGIAAIYYSQGTDMRFVTYLLAGSSLVAGTLLEVSTLTINTTHCIWLVTGAVIATVCYLLFLLWKNRHQQIEAKHLYHQLVQFWCEAAMAGFVILVLREMRLQGIELPIVMLAVPVVVALWLDQTPRLRERKEAA